MEKIIQFYKDIVEGFKDMQRFKALCQACSDDDTTFIDKMHDYSVNFKNQTKPTPDEFRAAVDFARGVK